MNTEKQKIDLGQVYPDLTGKPLQINGHETLSARPDRYKQHGFHFNADNCIACHACETACAEKNGTPAHLSYRTVGYVEGGSYPDVVRINISMACNHCEDPVCLKGCPTRAYTKYVEYGAVLQDPDICFGCGYCTWVCPYNAPVLDTVKGEVQKCNMCVDRLEDGLKPACVAACLSNALDFGVIESVPEGQEQAKLDIPGFPDPAITKPNIRFQQKRSLPAMLTRAGNDPFLYEKKEGNGGYKVTPIDQNKPAKWSELRSREDSLVLFTLLSQWAVGAFFLLYLLGPSLLAVVAHPDLIKATLALLVGFQAIGFVNSTLHLGKPRFCYRALNNLRHSPVSQEILVTSAFFGLLTGYTGLMIFPAIASFLPPLFQTLIQPIGLAGCGVGLLGIYCIYRCYKIPARPFWNHWHTAGAFFASALILGSLLIGVLFGLAEWRIGQPVQAFLSTLSWPLLLGLLVQAVSLFGHLRYLESRGEEAAVSRMLMLTRFKKFYGGRLVSLSVLAIVGGLSAFGLVPGGWGLFLWVPAFPIALLHEVVGRALFYVLVMPTTIPGSFFWGNKAFADHARKTGLSDRPQVGVVSSKHSQGACPHE
jgi:DMSO reductase iron-sulfur subunit